MELSKTNWPAVLLVAFFGVVVTLVLLIVIFESSQKPKSNSTAKQQSLSGSVTISKSGFSPATISVKKGATVTWVNQDSKIHRVASDPHPSHTLLPTLDSDDLANGDTYTFTFEKTGKFTYHDENNPLTIRGEVDVQ